MAYDVGSDRFVGFGTWTSHQAAGEALKDGGKKF